MADLDQLLSEVNYKFLNEEYVPSIPALAFINFIKLVNGAAGEENKTPVIHLDMVDNAAAHNENLFVAFRGSAKTTALHEYMYLFLATYGEFFDFGEVAVAMYISDTIDNGVKSMRKQLQFRYENSDFLQKYVPYANFTDVRWEFENLDGHRFCVRGFGASTGVRGFKEYGQRPTWCGFDDLMSDKNSESATIVRDIKNIIYKAARQAMHPKKRKMIWTGTPFNKRDPLHSAAESEAWNVRVYPICEQYPCTREEFVGAWEDRFSYDFVKHEYDVLKESNELQSFNQELMLKITSEEERLVQDGDIRWYSRDTLMDNKGSFNFYITTDFATSAKQSADFSVIAIWALNSQGSWFLVDGICKRQGMGDNIDELFRLAQLYKPQSVGVEVSGQQGGFIPWIQKEMMVRKIWFTLASGNNSNAAGIRPSGDKLVRFNTVVPWFKQGMMHFPEEYRKTHPLVVEMIEEISLVTFEGFKSKHDDAADSISMLSVLKAWMPSEEVPLKKNEDTGLWEMDEVDDGDSERLSMYIV